MKDPSCPKRFEVRYIDYIVKSVVRFRISAYSEADCVSFATVYKKEAGMLDGDVIPHSVGCSLL